MITTLSFYLYAIPVFLKTLVTTSYALLVYFVLHVESPRINEAKYCINWHVVCKYTCIKTQQISFLAFFIHATFVWTWSIWRYWKVKGWRAFLTSPDITITICQQCLRDRYQATGTVKDRCRFGQPRMGAGLKIQLTSIVYRQYLHRRYPFHPATVSVRRIVGLKG